MRSVAETSLYIPPQDAGAKEAFCKQELISDISRLPIMFSDDPHALFENYQPESVIAVRSPMPDHDYFVRIARAPASYTAKRQEREEDDVEMKDAKVAAIKTADPKSVGRRQPLRKKRAAIEMEESSEDDDDEEEDGDEADGYDDICMDDDAGEGDEEEDEEEAEEDEEEDE